VRDGVILAIDEHFLPNQSNYWAALALASGIKIRALELVSSSPLGIDA
jgi:hypothetical protein